MQHQRKRQRRAQIKTPHQRRGSKRRFTAGKPFHSGVVGPIKRRASDGVVNARSLKARSMQNGDDVARSRALEILITLRGSVVGVAACRTGEKSFRLHLRVYGLAEDVVEGEAENERAQIVDAGDAAYVMSKSIFRVEVDLVTALVNRWVPDASVENPKIVQVHVGFFAGLGAKLYLRRPPAPGEIFGPRSEVHAAIDGPEYGISQDRSLDRRAANIGNEKPGLPRIPLHRVSGEGEVKNRNALDAEGTVVNGGIAANFHNDLVCIELPLGTRQFAGGDRAVVNDVVVGTGLLHHAAGKGKGIFRRQDHPLPTQLHARGPDYVLKPSGFSPAVIGGMSGFDMLVVRTAVEHHVTIRDRLTSV